MKKVKALKKKDYWLLMKLANRTFCLENKGHSRYFCCHHCAKVAGK